MPCLVSYGKIGPSQEVHPLEGINMVNLKNNLEQREKPELIAIITLIKKNWSLLVCKEKRDD